MEKKGKTIDRNLENKLVLQFQETGDEEILEQIHQNRESTFSFLEGKYSWLDEDIRSEIIVVFIKSVHGYKSGKKSFNTYFFTSVLNHMRNIIKSKSRHKRTPPEGFYMIHLDESVDDEGSDGSTYHDLIYCPHDNIHGWMHSIDIRTFISMAQKQSWILGDMLYEIASGKASMNSRMMYFGDVDLEEGEKVRDAISRDSGLPKKFYKVIDFKPSERHIHYHIDVSSRKCISELAGMIYDQYNVQAKVDEGETKDSVV